MPSKQPFMNQRTWKKRKIVNTKTLSSPTQRPLWWFRKGCTFYPNSKLLYERLTTQVRKACHWTVGDISNSVTTAKITLFLPFHFLLLGSMLRIGSLLYVMGKKQGTGAWVHGYIDSFYRTASEDTDIWKLNERLGFECHSFIIQSLHTSSD